MKVLGLDPGVAIFGYGIIKEEDDATHIVKYGCIRTKKEQRHHLRLQKIYQELQRIIKEYQPECLALEEIFFSQNVKTAFRVGEVRGVALLVAAQVGLEIYEYTPLEVKMAVTGYGKATKSQVRYMIKSILNLNSVPKLDDITDALAVAVCHLHSRRQ